MAVNWDKVKVSCEENPVAAEALNRMFFNFSRSESLCKIYSDLSKGKGRKSVHQADLLRAAVVLTHAALEDSLRTIASHFMPIGDSEKLNKISLSGLNNSGRPEKFLLGELHRFKGKTVEEVIDESVTQHLGRLTFNNVNDITSMLKDFGLAPSEFEQFYPDLGSLISRRHQIVHMGDRVDNKGRGKQYAESIRLSTVEKWRGSAMEFIARISFATAGEGVSMSMSIT